MAEQRNRWRPAGVWGIQWQNLVRDFYPGLHRELVRKDLFFPIAYEVDVEGDEIYEKYFDGFKGNAYYRRMSGAAPRPDGWNETIIWERAKKFYVEDRIFYDVIFPRRTQLTNNREILPSDRQSGSGQTRTYVAAATSGQMEEERQRHDAMIGKETPDD